MEVRRVDDINFNSLTDVTKYGQNNHTTIFVVLSVAARRSLLYYYYYIMHTNLDRQRKVKDAVARYFLSFVFLAHPLFYFILCSFKNILLLIYFCVYFLTRIFISKNRIGRGYEGFDYTGATADSAPTLGGDDDIGAIGADSDLEERRRR